MRNALIISYYFPPSGGPGVQRVLKFTKYLPEFGWRPVILTVPATAEFPALDESLLAEIPKDAKVYRSTILEFYALYRRFVKSGEDKAIDLKTVQRNSSSWREALTRLVRAGLFIPDGRIGWLRPGVRMGETILKSDPPKVIIASGPPFTAFWIGKKLSEKSGIPLVLDFRDPWTQGTYYPVRPALSQKLDLRLEAACLEQATKVLTVNEQIQEDLERIHGVPRDKFVTLPNGFDEADFPPPPPKFSRWTISHTGSIFASRVPDVFLEELGHWLRRDPSRIEKTRLVLAGRFCPEMNESLARHLPPEVVENRGYVSHQESVRILQQSDRLLLLAGTDAQSAGMLTGKIFEYLGSGTPITALAPTDGELARLLSETRAGSVSDPEDREAIRHLIDAFGDRSSEGPASGSEGPPDHLRRFTRRFLTGALADVLGEVSAK